MPMPLTEDEVEEVYAWVDQVPLSRPKRNISRDFSDGVLLAEAVSHFYPKLVEMHNYSAANAHAQKLYNWQTLNKKVLKRLGITLGGKEMEDACNCVPLVVESILFRLQARVEEDKARLDSSAPRRPHASAPPKPKPYAPLQPSLSPPAAPYSAPQPHAGGGRQGPGPSRVVEESSLAREVDTEILIEKEQRIVELQDTVGILESKVHKLEQLLRLKDAKIQALTARLHS